MDNEKLGQIAAICLIAIVAFGISNVAAFITGDLISLSLPQGEDDESNGTIMENVTDLFSNNEDVQEKTNDSSNNQQNNEPVKNNTNNQKPSQDSDSSSNKSSVPSENPSSDSEDST